MGKVKRNSSVEFLRLFFMLGIVLYHVYCHGSHLNLEWLYSQCGSYDKVWNMLFYALGKTGITGFMFISGLYGVNGSKKIINFIFVTAFYGFILMLYSGISLRKIMLLPLSFDLWWYVSCYVVLMLVSPIINKGIETLSKKQLEIIVWGMLVYTYVLGFFNWADSRDFILLFTIYLFARYIKLCPQNKLKYFCVHYGGVFYAFTFLRL